MALWHQTIHYINKHDALATLVGWDIVKIIVLFIVVQLGIVLTYKIVRRAIRMRKTIEERRKQTIESLFLNIIRYVFYFIYILMILPIFGIHIAALLAGAGVAGIAIAFAAQSLLKDFFNGFFILIEDQYDVGDYVVINGVWGSVKTIGIRMTTLQVWTGQVVTIPNGEIKQITNYSKENSFAVIDVNIGYDSEAQDVIQIVERVMNELKEEQENIVGDVSVLGVQELNDWNYTIRAIAECLPYTHWGIQRLAKQRLREAFNKEGIDLPLQKIYYLQDHQFPKSFHPEEPNGTR